MRDRLSRIGLLAGSLALVLAACQSQAPSEKLFIESRHDADVNFSAYQRYAWAAEDDARASPVFLAHPGLPDVIVGAVDSRLAAKGFRMSPAEQADFLVAMSARVQEVTVISKRRYTAGSHGYNRAALYSVNNASQLEKKSEGTLILEIIDTTSEGVVWRSQAAGVIGQRDDLDQAVNAAVARMLEQFPPQS